MNTETVTAELPQSFRDRYAIRENAVALFFGKPIAGYSKDDLLAIINFLAEREAAAITEGHRRVKFMADMRAR